jgi:hypothetical protein
MLYGWRIACNFNTDWTMGSVSSMSLRWTFLIVLRLFDVVSVEGVTAMLRARLPRNPIALLDILLGFEGSRLECR